MFQQCDVRPKTDISHSGSSVLDTVQSTEHTSTHFICKILLNFIYFQREGKGGRKRGRETSVGCL